LLPKSDENQGSNGWHAELKQAIMSLSALQIVDNGFNDAISKPRYCYDRLFLFGNFKLIMPILLSIMTLFFWFFLQCLDYYFLLFHYLQKDY
jgi:hypothetical protein